MSKLLDRVETLEKTLEEMAKAIQAIARCVGVTEVQEEMAKATQANMKAQVEAGLKEGQIKPAEVVSENGFVVLHEKTKDGKLVLPGRLQHPLQAFDEDTRKLLVGKKPGETIELPNGTITIDEAYEVVEKAAQAAPAPAPATKRTKVKAN